MTATLETIEGLRLAVESDPGVRPILADALEERGELEEANRQRVIALVVNWSEAVEHLKVANGRRRCRTLAESDLVYIAQRALADEEGWWSIGGGTVANCYGYPSYQTVAVAAVRTDGRIRVGVALQRANKGSSQTTAVTGLSVKAKPDQFRTWANQK